MLNSLDSGEAAVIQLAINENIQTVCIDEATGRRVARLSCLSVTGTIGILLGAKREGYSIFIQESIQRMLARGIRLSKTVINSALEQEERELELYTGKKVPGVNSAPVYAAIHDADAEYILYRVDSCQEVGDRSLGSEIYKGYRAYSQAAAILTLRSYANA